VMLLLLLIGPKLLPEYRDPNAGGYDLPSAGLSLAAVLAVVYGLKQSVQDGVGPQPALFVLAGLALGLVFVWRQRRLANPLVDLGLFRVRAFSSALVLYLLATFVAFAAFLFVFQYLQLVLGKSPLEAALWSMPSFAAFIVGSLLTAPLVRRVRPAYAMCGGLALAATGYALLSQVGDASGLGLLVVATVVFSLGEAPVFTLTNDVVIRSAPVERAGAAAALSETASELGGALGIAVLGSIGTVIYRGNVSDGIPRGVPPDAADAARDTLGGAVAAAAELPDAVAANLLEVARAAFTQGLQVAALTSAVIAAGMAVVAILPLRQRRQAHAGGEQADVGAAAPVLRGHRTCS
jgi:DHA2 family multidrug resistance protein-like MFS transporter